MKAKEFIIGGLLLCAAVAAYSDTNTTTDVTSTVVSQIQTAATSATAHLTAQALKWCGIFATLQFVVSNIKIIRESGDLPQVVAKLTGSIMWVGIVIYLINNGPTFIRNVGNQLQGLTGVTLPTPGSILETTFSLGGVGALLAASTGPLAPVAGDILWDVDMLLMGIGIYFACKLFMMQLEVALIAMMAPLSFSFLGLNAFRDQGFAPFKSLVALSFRIVLVGVIIQAYQGIFSDLQTAWSGLTWNQVLLNGVGSTIETTLTDLGAVIVLAFVMFKSDSIASALASGSSSLGPGDVMQAAAAGAALGAAAHVTGSAVKATKPARNMSEFMKGLMGGGQSTISNASPIGGGGDLSPFASPASAPASSSLASSSVSGSPGGTSPAAMRSLSAAADGRVSKPSLSSGRYGQEAPETAGVGSTGASTGEQASVGSGAAASSSATADGSTSSPQPAAGARGTAQETRPATVADAPPGPSSIGGTGGAKSSEAAKLDQLLDTLSSQGARKPSLGDRMSETGRHISQEKATVSVTINPHHND